MTYYFFRFFCTQFLLVFLFILDLITPSKEAILLSQSVTWLGTPHLWSLGESHLASYSREGCNTTEAFYKFYMSAKMT